jgi:fatty-acyl-CoA synthase
MVSTSSGIASGANKNGTDLSTDVAAALFPFIGEDLVRSRIDVTTLGDLLLNAWDRHPDQAALIFPDASWTYDELVQRAMRTARGLKAMGVKQGDHVGILMPTSPELVEMFFATALCGAAAVLINARYRSAELAYVIENADIVTLLTTSDTVEQVSFVERINGALPELSASKDPLHLSLTTAPRLRNIVLSGKISSPGFINRQTFEQAAEAISELDVHRTRVAIRVRDVCMILYTSGTTSNPKGCLLTHESLVRTSNVLGRHRFKLTHEDKVWSPLPLFHIAAMLPLVATFAVGGTYLGMAWFDPGVALQMIEQHKVTMAFSPFVTFLQALIFHPDFKKTDLTSVRLMNSCFAVQPKSVADAYREAMPDTMQMGTYGMTEACGIVSTGHWDMDRELGFSRLGLALLGVEVQVVHAETGKDIPVGTSGEICLRGYSMFDGYYRDPVKNAESFDQDGWFHTGDIGSIDAAGHLMFDSRLKDMLKVGGENVAAAEIEAVLSRHPAVKLAQVVGMPDPKYVEVPAAFIELTPGAQTTEAELIAFCKNEIAGFKVPRVVRFLTEWPMSASKIQKFQLRDALLKEFGHK